MQTDGPLMERESGKLLLRKLSNIVLPIRGVRGSAIHESEAT